MNGITKISHNAPRKTCGVGYVLLSRAQPIDTYISSCFRNNTITIITEENEIIPNCIVAKNAWQYIEFPTTLITRGSALVWVNVPFQNKVIILDVLHKRDELNPIQSSGQFKFQRKVAENIVTVQGDGTTGIINIIAQGTASQQGEIYIKVLNENELAIFDVYVQGVTNLTTESDLNLTVGGKLAVTVANPVNPGNQFSLQYILGKGLLMQDEFKNNFVLGDGGIHLETPTTSKVYARASGAASQPGLLGTATNIVLNDIKNLLNSIITTLQAATGGGTDLLAAPVLAQTSNWITAIAQIQADMQNIISQNFELS